MSDVTMEQMLEKMQEIEKLMAQAGADPTVENVTAVATRAEAVGRELESMGKAYVEQQRTKMTGRRGFTEVVLTPEQRRRIQQKTGIEMASVLLPDDTGTQAQIMPTQDPRIIEHIALQQAERRKQKDEADEITRRELNRAIADLQAQNNSELQAQLDRLLADPNFAGGLLQKK